MPIIQIDDESLIKQSPLLPTIDVNPIKTTSNTNDLISTDNSWVTRFNLLTHIEGYSWSVNYYSQVLNQYSETSGQQLTISAANQQYKRIKDFNIKVTDPLTSSQSQDDKTITVTGEGIAIGVFIPNDGDMFVADIGQNVLATFQVVTTQKLSIYKEAAYKLTYVLIDTDVERIKNLKLKTVETLNYIEHRTVRGDVSLVTNEAYHDLASITNQFERMINYYFKRFYSNEFKTLILPVEGHTVYDHYITNAILSEFNSDLSKHITSIRRLNTQDDDNLNGDSVWDAIRYRDRSFLKTCFKHADLISTKEFSNLPVTNSLRFTGISKCVYPSDQLLTVDNIIKNNSKIHKEVSVYTPQLIELQNDSPVGWYDGTQYGLLGNGVLNNHYTQEPMSILDLPPNPSPLVDIPPVINTKGSYMFTEGFYNDKTFITPFETMVLNYIKNKPTSSKDISRFINEYHEMNLLQQFYYIPVLLIVMKSIMRGST